MMKTYTNVVAMFVMVSILTAEGWFGAGFTGVEVLFGFQLCLQVLFAPGNFFHSTCHCSVSFKVQ